MRRSLKATSLITNIPLTLPYKWVSWGAVYLYMAALTLRYTPSLSFEKGLQYVKLIREGYIWIT